MRLPLVLASGFGLLAPTAAWAGPPELPEGDAAPVEPEPTPADPAPADPAPPGDDTGFGAEGDVSGSASLDAENPLATADADAKAAADTSDDPGMVRGRREPLMPMNFGSIGLFHTALPDAGGKFTFRFRLHTDFFRKDGFIFDSPTLGQDQHARVRGGVTLGFSPLQFLELFFAVKSQANRNNRRQPGRQDSDTMFALGDIDFGAKGAYRFKNGIGLGGQFGLGLLSGSTRLRTTRVNFWFDALFAVDVRYLTKKHFPFRFTTNIGWMFDDTLDPNVADYGAIRDDISREVTRFSLGANHSRLRMRYAIDFPVRLGKERQFGIDPILEWSWDVSTQEEQAFARTNAAESPLPRSSQWMTLGVRANAIAGLHLDAAIDIGMVSPSFQFGPPVPPWQLILGIGWSFDPNPTIKEVKSDVPPPPPTSATPEGRLVGQVVDPSGAPISEARISFPGLTSTSILTDAQGNFTSFRFPAGTVTVQVSVGGQVVHETTAQVSDGEDTPLQIQLQSAPAPASGIMQGAIVDGNGRGVAASMKVTGPGVDQAFDANADGLIALELAEGNYTATVSAPGFRTKSTNFTVVGGQEVNVNVTLESEAPVATPNVSSSGNSIKLKKAIRYDGNDVAASSHAILDELAAFLNAHPEIMLVQIGVHTDDRGAAQARSDARAESVVGYLVSKGVSSTRLEAKGFGATKPVAVNMTASGRAKNNRTALTIKQK